MTFTNRTLHDRAVRLAASAIDGDLTAAEAVELEAHLTDCADCVRIATAMRSDAVALARPLDRWPSRRADENVAAAVARHGAWSPRSVLLVAAVLILLAVPALVAVGAYLQRTAENDLLTTVLPSLPSLAPVSPGPDEPPSATLGHTWDAVGIEASSTGRSIEAVAVAGSNLVGVGRGECIPNYSDATACYGAAWTASAGHGWTAAPNQPGLRVGHGPIANGFPLRGISDIVDGPAGLVAIGYDVNPPRSACDVAPCPTGPAVWRSADGRTWERAHIDLGPGVIDRFSQPIAAITADDRGYVMVGYAQTLLGDGSVGARAAAWFSPDGIDWTRAADLDDLDVGPCQDTGEEPNCGGMLDVAATDGGFVAVGHALNGNDGQSRPAAWTSPDGLTWKLATSGLDFDGQLSAVTSGASGIVGVGQMCTPDCVDSNFDGVAAVLADGTTWAPTPLTGAPALSAVASTNNEYFAIGVMTLERPVPGPRAVELQLWRSVDGLDWRHERAMPTIPNVADYLGSDIVAGPDRLVVVASALVPGTDNDFNVSYSSPAAGPTEPASSSTAARRRAQPSTNMWLAQLAMAGGRRDR